ncbi:hypothetical protein N2152v2_000506 [Parachlorella kessleri]
MRADLFLLLTSLVGALAVYQEAPLCQTYKVQPGDSVWGIAKSHGLLQTDLTDALAQCLPGGYVDGQTVLQAGEEVCLPPYFPDCQYVSNSGGNAQCKLYTVQTGDTLSGVATKFSIYINDLQDLNSDVLDDTTPMRTGLKLRLPPWDKNSCPDPSDTAPSCRYYIVQGGDYVNLIAAGFGVSVDDLLAANTDLANTSTLAPGMRVKIPPFPGSCGKGYPAKFPTEGINLCRLYNIKEGDSLSSIAVKFGSTVADLVALNPEFTDPNLLQPGKQIKIPKWDATCTTGIVVPGAPVPPSPPSPPRSPPPPPRSPKSSPPPLPSPSPSPVVIVPAPAPAPSMALPNASVVVDLTITGITVDDFETELAATWEGAMADLVSLPVDFVSIEAVSPAVAAAAATTPATAQQSSRKLRQDATAAAPAQQPIDVSTRIATPEPEATAGALQAALVTGELGDMLASMKLTLTASKLEFRAAAGGAPCTTPVIATGSNVPSPSPLASPSSPSSPPPSPLFGSLAPVILSPSLLPLSPPPPTASPSPAPQQSPLPSPTPSSTVKVTATVSGASVAEFAAGYARRWVTAMAQLANLSEACVSISSVTPAASTATRRLQAASDSVVVVTSFAVANATATSALLQATTSSGRLAQAVASVGLRLAMDGSAAPPPSPPPSSVDLDNHDSSSSSTGAIVGGVVGGVAVLAAVLAFLIIRRRRDRAHPAASSSPPARAGRSVATVSAPSAPPLSLRQAAAAAKAADPATGYSSSPRMLTPRRGQLA